MLRIAAARLECAPEDLQIENGRIGVVGSPGSSLPIRAIARLAYDGVVPPDVEPGLEETCRFRSPDSPYGFGAYVAAVRIDPDTGAIAIECLVAVDDCGTVLNAMILEGQIHGGVVQGIGQALYEQVWYTDEGQPIGSSLMDYAVPRAQDVPNLLVLDHTVTPSPLNVLGAKGGGEAGNIGGLAAISNAVIDALECGGAKLEFPLKPERICEILRTRARE
jgi:carbon-monoxide dehydrogenase large subunit